MANRKPKPAVRTSRRIVSSAAERDELTAKKLLTYLASPLYLPPFDANRSSYKHFIIRTIRDLLIDAVRSILPQKVVGVQFIFARRLMHAVTSGDTQVTADFSFPLLLCCRTPKEAIQISDGMAYVTKYLLNRKSSFHLRVRRFGLTYSPAVCIFSTSPDANDFSNDSTTVFWVKLPAGEADDSQITFPRESLEELVEPPFNNRTFFEADLTAAIEGHYYDQEKSSVLFQPSVSTIKVIRQSHSTAGYSRKKALEDMRSEFSTDVNYLKRVSYLLKFGDVILCTPHAYDDIGLHAPDRPTNSHEMITDAGLTVIVDRSKGVIEEDDWLRVQVVAQKLAIFAGAAISTASEARGSILRTLNRGFEHEFRNARVSINGRLQQLAAMGNPLSSMDVDDIEGRLKFTQRYIDSAVNTYKSNETDDVAIQSLLDNLISPLQKFRNVNIEVEIDFADNLKVMKLWSAVVIEVLRNAYKYGATDKAENKKIIRVSATLLDDHVVITVTNELAEKHKSTYEFTNRPKGWELIQEISSLLQGKVEAIVEGVQVSVVVRMPLVNITGGHDV